MALVNLDGSRGEQAVSPPRCGQHPRIGHPSSPGASQVRGVLAERVVVSTELDPFLSLKALGKYSGLSVRKLREYLVDPAHPLPCYRVGGKVLVRRSEFDAWIATYRQVGQPDVDRIVAEVLQDVQGS
jgi:hypothetical protein